MKREGGLTQLRFERRRSTPWPKRGLTRAKWNKLKHMPGELDVRSLGLSLLRGGIRLACSPGRSGRLRFVGGSRRGRSRVLGDMPDSEEGRQMLWWMREEKEREEKGELKVQGWGGMNGPPAVVVCARPRGP